MTSNELIELRECWKISLQRVHHKGCELIAGHEACAINKLLDELEIRAVLLSELADVSLNMTHSDHVNPCYRVECGKCLRESKLYAQIQT